MREMRGEVGKETPKKQMENMTSKVVQIGLRLQKKVYNSRQLFIIGKNH